MESIDDQLTIKHPAWKHALDQMRLRGVSYGVVFTTAELAEWLRSDPQSNQFVWGIIALRHRLEGDDGYYLARIENGAAWKIVEAEMHEDVAQRFDIKVRRYAVRSVNIRNATLTNPKAALSDNIRADMERNLEHAATRLALISRRSAPTIQ